MLLAFWNPPRDEDVDRIKVLRAASQAGPYAEIAEIYARDGYDNHVTHYEDENGAAGSWYRAEFLKDSIPTEQSVAKAGVTPYTVTPQMVLDVVQGLPLSLMTAEVVHRYIGWMVELAQTYSRMSLSEQTIIKEPHGFKAYNRIVGYGRGDNIRMQHFPVIDIDAVYYRVRGAQASVQDVLWQNLDIEIRNKDMATGYNRGEISIYPRDASVMSVLNLTSGDTRRRDLSILFSYRHGWTTWPGPLANIICHRTAADIMEIAGEASTAGLSSRSIDGYSESYTASATTTIFSARRMMYLDQFKEIMKHYRKPLYAA